MRLKELIKKPITQNYDKITWKWKSRAGLCETPGGTLVLCYLLINRVLCLFCKCTNISISNDKWTHFLVFFGLERSNGLNGRSVLFLLCFSASFGCVSLGSKVDVHEINVRERNEQGWRFVNWRGFRAWLSFCMIPPLLRPVDEKSHNSSLILFEPVTQQALHYMEDCAIDQATIVTAWFCSDLFDSVGSDYITPLTSLLLD